MAVALVLVAGQFAAAQDAPNIDELWAQAAQLERSGAFDAAAEVYAQILELLPDSQRAAAKIGVCQFQAGRRAESLESAAACIQMNPYSRVWAEWGYLTKAQACRHLGCVEDAREAIAVLRNRFPDSFSTARAEVLEAELDGVDPTAAQEALAREEEAEGLHDQAQAAQRSDPESALALYAQVIDEYGDTHKSLRSMEMRAMFLAGLPDRTEETVQAFHELFEEVRDSFPHSRLRYEAQFRIAALHQRLEQFQQAYETYANLAEIAQDPAVKSNARLQATGAYFEKLQRQFTARQPVTEAEWDQLRTFCAQVRDLPYASPLEHVRADLMRMESFWWQLRPQQTLAAGEGFLAAYGGEEWPKELATARLAIGESLQKLGHHAEALEHYAWIVERYGEQEIWPGLTNLQQTYYRIYDALRRGGASWEEIDAAAEVVLTRYPDSRYADLIRNAMSRERR